MFSCKKAAATYPVRADIPHVLEQDVHLDDIFQGVPPVREFFLPPFLGDLYTLSKHGPSLSVPDIYFFDKIYMINKISFFPILSIL